MKKLLSILMSMTFVGSGTTGIVTAATPASNNFKQNVKESKNKQKIDDLKKELADIQSQIDKLQKDNEELIKQIANTHDQISSIQEKVNKLAAEKQNLEDSVKKAQNELDKLKMQENDEAEALGELQKTIKAQAAQIDKLNSKYDKQHEIVENLSDEIDRLVQDQEKTKAEINKKTNEIKELHNTINALNDSNDKLKKDIENNNKQLDKNEKTIKNVKSDINDLNSQISKLDSDNKDDKVTIDKLTKSKSDKENQLKELQSSNAELKQTNADLNSQIQDQTKKITEKTNQIANVEKEIKVLQDKYNDLNSQLAKLNNDIAVEEEKLRKLEGSINDATNSLAASTKQRDDLKQSLGKIKESIKDSVSERQAAEAQLDEIAKNIDAELNLLDAAKQSIEALNSELKTAHDNLDKAQKDLKDVQDKYNDAEAKWNAIFKGADISDDMQTITVHMANAEKIKDFDSLKATSKITVNGIDKHINDFAISDDKTNLTIKLDSAIDLIAIKSQSGLIDISDGYVFHTKINFEVPAAPKAEIANVKLQEDNKTIVADVKNGKYITNGMINLKDFLISDNDTDLSAESFSWNDDHTTLTVVTSKGFDETFAKSKLVGAFGIKNEAFKMSAAKIMSNVAKITLNTPEISSDGAKLTFNISNGKTLQDVNVSNKSSAIASKIQISQNKQILRWNSFEIKNKSQLIIKLADSITKTYTAQDAATARINLDGFVPFEGKINVPLADPIELTAANIINNTSITLKVKNGQFINNDILDSLKYHLIIQYQGSSKWDLLSWSKKLEIRSIIIDNNDADSSKNEYQTLIVNLYNALPTPGSNSIFGKTVYWQKHYSIYVDGMQEFKSSKSNCIYFDAPSEIPSYDYDLDLGNFENVIFANNAVTFTLSKKLPSQILNGEWQISFKSIDELDSESHELSGDNFHDATPKVIRITKQKTIDTSAKANINYEGPENILSFNIKDFGNKTVADILPLWKEASVSLQFTDDEVINNLEDNHIHISYQGEITGPNNYLMQLPNIGSDVKAILKTISIKDAKLNNVGNIIKLYIDDFDKLQQNVSSAELSSILDNNLCMYTVGDDGRKYTESDGNNGEIEVKTKWYSIQTYDIKYNLNEKCLDVFFDINDFNSELHNNIGVEKNIQSTFLFIGEFKNSDDLSFTKVNTDRIKSEVTLTAKQISEDKFEVDLSGQYIKDWEGQTWTEESLYLALDNRRINNGLYHFTPVKDGKFFMLINPNTPLLINSLNNLNSDSTGAVVSLIGENLPYQIQFNHKAIINNVIFKNIGVFNAGYKVEEGIITMHLRWNSKDNINFGEFTLPKGNHLAEDYLLKINVPEMMNKTSNKSIGISDLIGTDYSGQSNDPFDLIKGAAMFTEQVGSETIYVQRQNTSGDIYSKFDSSQQTNVIVNQSWDKFDTKDLSWDRLFSKDDYYYYVNAGRISFKFNVAKDGSISELSTSEQYAKISGGNEIIWNKRAGGTTGLFTYGEEDYFLHWYINAKGITTNSWGESTYSHMSIPGDIVVNQTDVFYLA